MIEDRQDDCGVANRLPLTPDWAQYHGSTEDASFPSEQAITQTPIRNDCLEALSQCEHQTWVRTGPQYLVTLFLIQKLRSRQGGPELKCNVRT